MNAWLACRKGLDRAFALGAYVSPRVTNYWHPKLGWRPEVVDMLACALADPRAGAIPPTSPIVWTPKARFRGPRDPAGFPIDSRSNDVFVIDAAQYILGLLDRADPIPDAVSSELSDALLALGEPGDHGLRFRCLTPAYHGTVPPGWRSAMAQGQVASALLRLGREDEAEAAVVEMLGDPEYVTEELGPPALRECVAPGAGVVLNGHLIALLGLAEVAVARPKFRDSLGTFVAGLDELADHFVTSRWSLYEFGSTRFIPASAFYHRLHADLLDVWARLTGSTRLRSLASTCRLTDSLPFRLAALRERLSA